MLDHAKALNIVASWLGIDDWQTVSSENMVLIRYPDVEILVQNLFGECYFDREDFESIEESIYQAFDSLEPFWYIQDIFCNVPNSAPLYRPIGPHDPTPQPVTMLFDPIGRLISFEYEDNLKKNYEDDLNNLLVYGVHLPGNISSQSINTLCQSSGFINLLFRIYSDFDIDKNEPMTGILGQVAPRMLADFNNSIYESEIKVVNINSLPRIH